MLSFLEAVESDAEVEISGSIDAGVGKSQRFSAKVDLQNAHGRTLFVAIDPQVGMVD